MERLSHSTAVEWIINDIHWVLDEFTMDGCLLESPQKISVPGGALAREFSHDSETEQVLVPFWIAQGKREGMHYDWGKVDLSGNRSVETRVSTAEEAEKRSQAFVHLITIMCTTVVQYVV